MIGKLISAGIGSRIAQSTPGVSEGTGAMIGVVAATLARRLGPVGMVAAAAGLWLYSQNARKDTARSPRTEQAKRSATTRRKRSGGSARTRAKSAAATA